MFYIYFSKNKIKYIINKFIFYEFIFYQKFYIEFTQCTNYFLFNSCYKITLKMLSCWPAMHNLTIQHRRGLFRLRRMVPPCSFFYFCIKDVYFGPRKGPRKKKNFIVLCCLCTSAHMCEGPEHCKAERSNLS